jgi:hypothetical protein
MMAVAGAAAKMLTAAMAGETRATVAAVPMMGVAVPAEMAGGVMTAAAVTAAAVTSGVMAAGTVAAPKTGVMSTGMMPAAGMSAAVTAASRCRVGPAGKCQSCQ